MTFTSHLPRHLFFPQDLNEVHKATNCEPLSNYKNFSRDQVGLAQIPDVKEAEAASHSTGIRGLRGRSTPEKRCNIMVCSQEADMPEKEGGNTMIIKGQRLIFLFSAM